MKIIITDTQTAEVLIYRPEAPGEVRFGALLTFVRQNHNSFAFSLSYYETNKPEDINACSRNKKQKIICNQSDLDYLLYLRKKEGIARLILRPLETAAQLNQLERSDIVGQHKGTKGKDCDSKTIELFDKYARRHAHKKLAQQVQDGNDESLSESEGKKFDQYIERKVSQILNKKIQDAVDDRIGMDVKKEGKIGNKKDKHKGLAKSLGEEQTIYKQLPDIQESRKLMGNNSQHYISNRSVSGHDIRDNHYLKPSQAVGRVLDDYQWEVMDNYPHNFKNANSQYYTVSSNQKSLRISDVKPLHLSSHQYMDDGETLIDTRHYFAAELPNSAYQIEPSYQTINHFSKYHSDKYLSIPTHQQSYKRKESQGDMHQRKNSKSKTHKSRKRTSSIPSRVSLHEGTIRISQPYDDNRNNEQYRRNKYFGTFNKLTSSGNNFQINKHADRGNKAGFISHPYQAQKKLHNQQSVVYYSQKDIRNINVNEPKRERSKSKKSYKSHNKLKKNKQIQRETQNYGNSNQNQQRQSRERNEEAQYQARLIYPDVKKTSENIRYSREIPLTQQMNMLEDHVYLQIRHKRHSKSKSKHKSRGKPKAKKPHELQNQSLSSQEKINRLYRQSSGNHILTSNHEHSSSCSCTSADKIKWNNSLGNLHNIISEQKLQKISKQYNVSKQSAKDIVVNNWHLSSMEIAQKLKLASPSLLKPNKIQKTSPGPASAMLLGQQSKYHSQSIQKMQNQVKQIPLNQKKHNNIYSQQHLGEEKSKYCSVSQKNGVNRKKIETEDKNERSDDILFMNPDQESAPATVYGLKNKLKPESQMTVLDQKQKSPKTIIKKSPKKYFVQEQLNQNQTPNKNSILSKKANKKTLKNQREQKNTIIHANIPTNKKFQSDIEAENQILMGGEGQSINRQENKKQFPHSEFSSSHLVQLNKYLESDLSAIQKPNKLGKEKGAKKNQYSSNNDIQLSQSLLSMTSNLISSTSILPFRRKISNMYSNNLGELRKQILEEDSQIDQNYGVNEKKEHKKDEKSFSHISVGKKNEKSSSNTFVPKKDLNYSSSIDFQKKLQNTDDLMDDCSQILHGDNVKCSDSQNKNGISKRTMRENGKIFMKMVQMFGNGYKSQIFKFIQQHEELSESQLIRKWEIVMVNRHQ